MEPPLTVDDGVKRFAKDVEMWLRPHIPKRLKLTVERHRYGIHLGIWTDDGQNVAYFLQQNEDVVDLRVALTWSNLIARSLMRLEVEREKADK